MEPSRFRRLIDSVIGVGFVQDGEVPLAAIVMPDTEPVRFAVGDLPGYGFEVVAEVDVPLVGTVCEFERNGVRGIGFIQKNTGSEVASIAWPEGEPRRYPAIDLAGAGVKILRREELPPSESQPVDSAPEVPVEGAAVNEQTPVDPPAPAVPPAEAQPPVSRDPMADSPLSPLAEAPATTVPAE